MPGSADEPFLLTPGPLTTSDETKRAMLRDWGSRDAAFIALTAHVRARLVALAGATGTHECVPIQGSGTFAVEAMLGTFVPKDGRVLVLVNGAYGRRVVRICETIGRAAIALETAEDVPPDPQAVADRLDADDAITHVVAVYCETTSGILNPIEEIAKVTAAAGRRLLIDAMSAFGALPVDAGAMPFEALAASANKCLEGVPGLGFVVAERDALDRAGGNAHSLALDLHDQWRAMTGNGQWRFTPPTHVIAALDRALDQLEAEGGPPARLARYSHNRDILVEGMRGMGIETLLTADLQAPIIVTFLEPEDARFDFETFHDKVRAEGYALYPGKLTQAASFRIGCIGDLREEEMRGALDAIRRSLGAMGVDIHAQGSGP